MFKIFTADFKQAFISALNKIYIIWLRSASTTTTPEYNTNLETILTRNVGEEISTDAFYNVH